MRRFFFNCFYVSGIRNGIQAGHSAERMWSTAVKNYLTCGSEENLAVLKYLLQFEEDHGTWVVLNGGEHDDLVELYAFLCDPANKFPVSKFHESGLGGT